MNIHDLPGYKGVSFLQILPQLYRDPLGSLTKIVSSGERVIPFQLGKYILFLVNDPSILRHILKTNYRNYPRGKSLKGIFPLLGKGLFTSDHNLWVKQQKNITPAFHTKNYSEFERIIREETDKFCSDLENFAKEHTTVDMQKEFKTLMLSILAKEMFSPDLKFNPETIITKLDAVLEYTSIKGELIRNVVSGVKGMFGLRYTPPLYYTESLKYLEDFVAEFFGRIMRNELRPAALTSILKELIEQGEIDDTQVRDEIMTFLFAGFDTVAEGLSWSQYLISANPGTGEKIISAHEPKYLQAVINEALRLYPPAWAFYRIVTEDDEIDGLHFPAKSYLMISPYLLHRTSKYWENPNLFNPERFIEEDQPEVNHFHYIPFGQGPHICTGRRIAMFEMHLILSIITPKFRFIYTGKNPPEADPGIIMKAKDALFFKVEMRP